MSELKAGRIETYIHSDNTTVNKAGVLVKVLCETDFAAKTDEFITFSKTIALYSCGIEATEYSVLISEYPEIEEQRVGLENILKEKVEVAEIMLLTVA